MKNLFARFARDNSGATAIEYGLIAAGIAAVVITAVYNLGSKVNDTFVGINNNLK
ncbi:Flp family type IVb pilin [Phreatobacter sp.]|uniref:Flp family type IVb pilin n=1 Tax=Phreatobacter sp. TaxID=1966341 RepID=UPI0025F54785|nr:Flp family type IVb pilin [Phreatobacter sp.]